MLNDNCWISNNNPRFCDLWLPILEGEPGDIKDSATVFAEEYAASPLYSSANGIVEADAKILYCLLYAKYGDWECVKEDINQMKYKFYSVIYTNGAEWVAKRNIQEKLRALLTDGNTDLFEVSKVINNLALNPNNEPTTEELDYISQQNVTKGKLNKMDAYGQLISLLKDDVTSTFLSKFKPLFVPFRVNTVEEVYES